MNIVAVYRHQLFKRSEPFIHTQAMLVPRYRPLFVGRSLAGEPPVGATFATLPGWAAWSTIRKSRQILSRDPTPFIDLLRAGELRLMHAHFGVEGVYAQPIAAALDIPLVTTFHGFDATMGVAALLRSGKPAWINYWLGRRSLAVHGSLFICVSDFIRRRVLSLGFPPQRTIVHYIGVDTQQIRPCVERVAIPTVLHVARLVEKKGSADLIKAFARVLPRQREAVLLIVGEGPLDASLRNLAKDLGIAASVAFLGPKPHAEVLALMATSWVFCLPSVTARSGDSEGLAIVLLEAAASGVPVVATRHGGIAEAIEHQQTGILVDEHDVDALASALTTLLHEEGTRLRMGVAARARVVQQFDLGRQSATLADIYDSVI